MDGVVLRNPTLWHHLSSKLACLAGWSCFVIYSPLTSPLNIINHSFFRSQHLISISLGQNNIFFIVQQQTSTFHFQYLVRPRWIDRYLVSLLLLIDIIQLLLFVGRVLKYLLRLGK